MRADESAGSRRAPGAKNRGAWRWAQRSASVGGLERRTARRRQCTISLRRLCRGCRSDRSARARAVAHLSPHFSVAILEVLHVWSAQCCDREHLSARVDPGDAAVPRRGEPDPAAEVNHLVSIVEFAAVNQLARVDTLVSEAIDDVRGHRHDQRVKEATPACAPSDRKKASP